MWRINSVPHYYRVLCIIPMCFLYFSILVFNNFFIWPTYDASHSLQFILYTMLVWARKGNLSFCIDSVFRYYRVLYIVPIYVCFLYFSILVFNNLLVYQTYDVSHSLQFILYILRSCEQEKATYLSVLVRCSVITEYCVLFLFTYFLCSPILVFNNLLVCPTYDVSHIHCNLFCILRNVRKKTPNFLKKSSQMCNWK